MAIGCLAGILLMTGVSIVQKCAVLPVSAIRAAHVGVEFDVGGPIVGLLSGDTNGVGDVSECVPSLVSDDVLGTMGFPPGQS